MALFMQLTPQWSGERNGRSGRAAISPTVEWSGEQSWRNGMAGGWQFAAPLKVLPGTMVPSGPMVGPALLCTHDQSILMKMD